MKATPRRNVARMLFVLVVPVLLGMVSSSCAAPVVRAYQRERLTDRIMSFQAVAKKDARATKEFQAREGSTGGNGGAGGGCACN